MATARHLAGWGGIGKATRQAMRSAPEAVEVNISIPEATKDNPKPQELIDMDIWFTYGNRVSDLESLGR